MRESEIKRKCRTLLEKNGWFVLHLISTNKPGIPDTIILKEGKTIFIEFKKPDKDERKLQDYRMKKLSEQGFKSYIIKSTEQLNELITKGGLEIAGEKY